MRRESLSYYESTKLSVHQAFNQLKFGLAGKGYILKEDAVLPRHIQKTGEILKKSSEESLGKYHIYTGAVTIEMPLHKAQSAALERVLNELKLEL